MQTEEQTITENSIAGGNAGEDGVIVNGDISSAPENNGVPQITATAEEIASADETIVAGGDDTPATGTVVEYTPVPLSINMDKVQAELKQSGEPVFAHIQLIEKSGIDAKKLPDEIKKDIKVWGMTRPRMEGDKSGKIVLSLKKRSVLIAHEIQDWLEKDYPEKSDEEVEAIIREKDEQARIEEEARIKAENDEKALAEEARIKAENDEKARVEEEARIKAENDEKARIEEEARIKLENDEKVRMEEEARIQAEKDVVARRKQVADERERKRKEAEEAHENALTVEQKQARAILEGLNEHGQIHYNELKKILGRNIGISAVKVGDTMVLHNVYMTNYYIVHKK